MKQKVVDIGGGSIYVINIPETATEGELSAQDRVILYLDAKLRAHKKSYNYEEGLKYIESSFVLDSRGLPAMLLGDVKKLLLIATGKNEENE